MDADATDRRDRFRALHAAGTFVMPNPFDRGSARLLATLGFAALATTSSGLAATRGQIDMTIDRDLLVAHVGDLARATSLPLSVDAERGFAEDPSGVGETIDLLADAGAAGVSIEDWDPAVGRIDPRESAVARVEAAAVAASRHGMVLTARCENHIHGVDDLDDTLARLVAYRDAGAEVVYAPGLVEPDDIRRVVEATGTAVNVLLRPAGPTVDDLAALGVRRVSVGGALAWAGYGAVVDAARQLLVSGTIEPGGPRLPTSVATEAFGGA